MELSQFTLGLIFIFLPGVVALVISERLTEHGQRKPYELVVYALLLGCAAHLIYPAVQYVVQFLCIPIAREKDRWLELMLEEEISIQSEVVLITAAIGAVLGVLLTYAANHSWLHRGARLIGVSKKFSDVDVWAYLMNSKGVEWVVVRFHSKNLMYQGAVVAFSTQENPRELLLYNVTVFTNDNGTKLYDTKSAYLSFEKKDVTLELQ